MKSYFDKSMFIQGIKYPSGGNIAPKTDNYNKNYNVNITNDSNIKILKTVTTENGLEIYGNFLSSETKETIIRNKTYKFYIEDKGYYLSTLIKNDDEITITTFINLNRETAGINFDDICFKDGLFKNIKHDNSSNTLNLKEHFKLSKNKKRLIHYSPDSPNFEVYNLPENFKLEDGLEKLNNPELFDDICYNNTDENIKEFESYVKKLKYRA